MARGLRGVWWLAAVVLGACLGSPALAQTSPQSPVQVQPAPPGTPLTLEDALAQGLANSQRLAEFEARAAAAAASEQGRAAARLPSVSLLGGYTRTNHVTEFSVFAPGGPRTVIYPDVPDNYRTRVDLQWPIYTAGHLDALERAAKAEHDATGEDLTAARADLRLEITRAFWALVTAREAEQVVAKALDVIGAHVRDLRTRLDQGLIPPNDVLTAEAQESRQRLLFIQAANQRGITEADLQRLLGPGAPGHIEPQSSLAVPEPATGAADTLIAQARQQRPERHALDDRVSAAKERTTAAERAAWPQLFVAGGYDYARPNPRIFPRAAQWEDSWDVSVNASWSLWDGGRNRAERAEAAALARAAEARAGDFDQQLVFEVRQRRLEVDSSRAAITTAADGVRAATEAYRVVGDRFRAGVATNTDVLDAESDLLQAQLEQTRALASARLADARLARAIGQ